MAVIWGFDLSEMKWSAFKGKNMFDRRWPLRRERFVLYQLAMLTCLAAECTATYSLSKYEFQQTNIQNLYASQHPNSIKGDIQVHNNPVIDAAILTIVFGVLVATLFGADFFFLLFFPRRIYPRWYNTTKLLLALVITAGVFAAALMSTIVVATQHVYINGFAVTPAEAAYYQAFFFRPPFEYKTWAVNIAWLVLIWVGLVSTVASTIIMYIAVRHDSLYGTDPKPTPLGDEEVLSPVHPSDAVAVAGTRNVGEAMSEKR